MAEEQESKFDRLMKIMERIEVQQYMNPEKAPNIITIPPVFQVSQPPILTNQPELERLQVSPMAEKIFLPTTSLNPVRNNPNLDPRTGGTRQSSYTISQPVNSGDKHYGNVDVACGYSCNQNNVNKASKDNQLDKENSNPNRTGAMNGSAKFSGHKGPGNRNVKKLVPQEI
ncbi:OLC1v1032933C1 [Oldenlandia corymbosa var. corymbosa]|uniref:OLC1v1032933C1 n=1 Tax=Oldenlandia corymbosa var. corymbosa TaxID=529605 RepID=A0AAV1CMY0_OLDCO|nr:OLC1v1032933C1 [Oldenlandia corymbosa var. corymbosa]